MIKKISLGVVALVAVTGGIAGMSAFEAHVINVTAKIENALKVNTTPIEFGTVFPQEQLDRELVVTLSDSFKLEDRVDDVKYMIRQKPKCGWTTDEGEEGPFGKTRTGEVIVEGASGSETTKIVCPEPVEGLASPPVTGATWGQLPLLCPYLSKHELTVDINAPTNTDLDVDVPAFHDAWVVGADGKIDWTEAIGYLSKLDGDVSDTWNIDLKVPCFGGNCAQDWASFVAGINDTVDADDYVLDESLEHKVFGCDLWIEVTGVSEAIID